MPAPRRAEYDTPEFRAMWFDTETPLSHIANRYGVSIVTVWKAAQVRGYPSREPIRYDNQNMPEKGAAMWRRWAVKWNGTLQGEGGNLPLFRTREECREFIKERYGYIKNRDDLRRPPHNWRMPVAVRVEVKEVL